MILYENNNKNYRLKLIDIEDVEDLRVWKNKNKESFFLKEDITEKQQTNWFSKYEKDKYNYMFVVQEKVDKIYINIGCMGYRIIDNFIDVYNIMRGLKVSSSELKMSRAFNLMNTYISSTYKYDLTCKVLLSNPVRNWYELLGFENQFEENDHVLYKLNIKKLDKIDYKKEEK